MRAAFRHEVTSVWVGKINYVTAIKPVKLDEAGVAEDILQVFCVLKNKPGYTRESYYKHYCQTLRWIR